MTISIQLPFDKVLPEVQLVLSKMMMKQEVVMACFETLFNKSDICVYVITDERVFLCRCWTKFFSSEFDEPIIKSLLLDNLIGVDNNPGGYISVRQQGGNSSDSLDFLFDKSPIKNEFMNSLNETIARKRSLKNNPEQKDGLLEKLERLSRLQKEGSITEAEYTEFKEKLLLE